MKQIINYVIANVIIPFVVYRKTQNEKELTSLESILSDSVRSLGLTLAASDIAPPNNSYTLYPGVRWPDELVRDYCRVANEHIGDILNVEYIGMQVSKLRIVIDRDRQILHECGNMLAK